MIGLLYLLNMEQDFNDTLKVGQQVYLLQASYATSYYNCRLVIS